jgi:hypothetical protein
MNLAKEQLHPKTLDFLAKNKPENSPLMEHILLNRQTPDETFLHLAQRVSGKALEIISENQQRMLREPGIASALKRNPNSPKSTIDKIVSFLRISGIQLEGESPELTPEEIKIIISETEKKKAFMRAMQERAKTGVQAAPDPALSKDSGEDEEDFYAEEEGDWEDDSSFGEDDVAALGDEFFDDKENVSEEEKLGISAKLAKMSVPQKIKLALLGNKEVRGILIKDGNKIVSTSVIKSPKLTDNEVHNIAQMRSVCDEIIRFIANNNDWVKNYSIKLALVNNPKTPVGISLKFMKFLNMKDTADLSRNKNISPQIQKLAKDQFNRMRGAA